MWVGVYSLYKNFNRLSFEHFIKIQIKHGIVKEQIIILESSLTSLELGRFYSQVTVNAGELGPLGKLGSDNTWLNEIGFFLPKSIIGYRFW